MNQNSAALLFALLVGSISERCFAAGWQIGIEVSLPIACRGRLGGPYGQSRIESEEASALADLMVILGGWPEAFAAVHQRDKRSDF